jgi:hypothetical protein
MSRRIRVKPSKSQSMLGFFVGIIFCFIGIFAVIPSFGPFGLFWTLIAIGITITNGYNAFSDKGIASSEIMIDDDNDYNNSFNNINTSSHYNTNEQHSNRSNNKTVEERLSDAQDLFDKGLITAEEYQNKREQILEDL